jgi:membrane protease YdiL (CAAX protease family)
MDRPSRISAGRGRRWWIGRLGRFAFPELGNLNEVTSRTLAVPQTTPTVTPTEHHRVSDGRRRQLMVLTGLVIVALAVLNVAKFLLPSSGVLISVVAAAALLVFARTSGLTWAQLGLGKDRLRAGVLWAAGAVVVVGAVYLLGVLSPLTRPAFLDSRYAMGLPQALLTAFVVIPLSTILLEEVAFRSVLWGFLSRHMTTWRVILVSSSLFGLWHVLPSLSFASSNQGLSEVAPAAGPAVPVLVVLGTVAFTAVGGIVAAELRRRSGSLLASAGMHWATNALGVLFGLVAWRLSG